jgi:hypothetical protein
MPNRLKIILKRIDVVAARIIFLFALALLLGQEYPAPGDYHTQVSRAVGDQFFDFVQWESDALNEKVSQIAVPVQNYLTDAQQEKFVLDYMDLMQHWSSLDQQVQAIYADASVKDPIAASADLRSKRDAARADLEQRRPTAEAIIQQQISSVLSDQGFDMGGELFPPVAVRITPLPYILIVSPRDQIKQTDAQGLQNGLNVDQAEQIETQILSETNHSALVVPIGGLAAYPAMVLETSQLLYLLQTSSHEWTHNWLELRPLGYSYLASDNGEIRTINETVASLVGDEVGLQVMRRYYPDALKRDFPDLVEPKPLQIPQPDQSLAPNRPSTPNEFSFNGAMHDTRVHVDALLADARSLEEQNQLDQADAKIAEAEQYMEQQRQMINSHGYRLRKINQAYFAFYGAYADQPGASGSDPIGPNVIALRVYSPSLRGFLDRVSNILTLDQLKQAVEALKPN